VSCQHDDYWIGEPIGCEPVAWRCTKCGMRFTAGEMELWQYTKRLITKLDEMIERIETLKKESNK